MDGATDNLRQSLREATSRAHDLLDRSMQEAAGWTSARDYARFLSLQYAARRPVEEWLDRNAPDEMLPPPQSPLIADDLARFGLKTPAHTWTFALDEKPIRREGVGAALGVAWVLAGSSLGNRAILAEIKRASNGSQWPHRFLGDESMLAFWKGLRRSIERPASIHEVDASTAAAHAVFAHFLRVAKTAETVS